jgi:hypothetical protein
MVHGDRQQAMLRWMGMVDKVALVRVTLPTFVSSPAFQVRILAATASIRGCSSARLIRFSDKKTPRYLHGKFDTVHGKTN